MEWQESWIYQGWFTYRLLGSRAHPDFDQIFAIGCVQEMKDLHAMRDSNGISGGTTRGNRKYLRKGATETAAIIKMNTVSQGMLAGRSSSHRSGREPIRHGHF